MKFEDITDTVARSPWFQGLPGDAIERLARAASVEEFPIDSRLYVQGEPSTKIFCIVKGRVRISLSSAHGHEFALVDREGDTWLGEPGLVNDQARILDGRVIEPATVLVIPREAVLEVGEEYPLMYRNLFHYHQGVLRDFHELMAGILFYPLRARLAGRLLHLVGEHGVPVEGGVQVNIKVSQGEFARLALGSRQRVNRLFREWSERGLVYARDGHLVIADVELLEREIESFSEG